MRNSIFQLLLIALFTVQCSQNGSSSANTDAASADQTAGDTYKPSVLTSLKIQLPDTTLAKSSSACLDVKVKDFVKIVSVQHSINWNPKILKFKSVQNFQISNLSESNFGLTQTDQGKMGFSWYDPAVKGLDLPDDKVLYQICFDVVGNTGAESQLLISGDPVTIEVTNNEQRVLGIPTGKGRVKVQ